MPLYISGGAASRCCCSCVVARCHVPQSSAEQHSGDPFRMSRSALFLTFFVLGVVDHSTQVTETTHTRGAAIWEITEIRKELRPPVHAGVRGTRGDGGLLSARSSSAGDGALGRLAANMPAIVRFYAA